MSAYARLLTVVFFLALSPAALAKGRLGFAVEAATNAQAMEVKVTSVRPAGPADVAGLKTGDIITELAGQRISVSNGSQLMKSLGSVKQGERLKLVVLRGGKPASIEIVAGPDI